MTKAVPLLATFGLVSLVVLPAPGIWGLVIGLTCTITILICGVLWLFDRAATHLACLIERNRNRFLRRRRAVHAGSGMMRKAKPEAVNAKPHLPA